MKFRYFITDNTNNGSLIIGNLNPQTMLLLLGMISLNEIEKSKIINFFVQQFQFSVEAASIEFSKLNTDDKYPYTCQISVIAEKRSNINQLTHSPNGEKCKGNGLNKNVECMCDECEHYLECFPDWRD